VAKARLARAALLRGLAVEKREALPAAPLVVF